jgi:hypothetical protein
MSELRSAVEAYDAVDPHLLPDSTLLTEIEELLAVRDRIDGVVQRLLAVADVRDATVAEFGRSTTNWLTVEMRLSGVEARRRVRVARDRPVRLVLSAAMDTGEVSLEHASRIESCLARLPVDWREESERILVEAARSVDPDALRPLVDQLRLRSGADESREAREQRMYGDRWCTTATTFDGMLDLHAMLDPTGGATVLAALTSLTGIPSGGDDDRTAGQRRADALVDLASYSLTAARLPDSGGDRPQITVTIDWDTLRDQLTTDATATATLSGPGMQPVDITPQTARRLACDADVLPVVLNGAGQVLDLGRTSRTWTTAQRRAARLRDSGCVWPGCHTTLDRCDLHHLEFWSHGGRSDLDNSAHVCAFHHWLVHHTTWTLRRDPTTKQIVVRRD